MRIERILQAASQQIGRQEARWLLEFVCACSHATLLARADEVLNANEAMRYAELVQRRLAGEPFAYLVGEAPFGDALFKVSPAVLIPRPETELLVDLACAILNTRTNPQKVLDLGTGSGIIAISVAKRCAHAQLTALDYSAEALTIAQENALTHGQSVRFLQGDWFSPLAADERFALIVSNPPYIAADDVHLLHNGLPFEPRLALTDEQPNAQGLQCIRHIVHHAPAFLAEGAGLLIEHGYDQAAKVRALLAQSGFSAVRSWRDTEDIERVSGGFWHTTTGL